MRFFHVFNRSILACCILLISGTSLALAQGSSKSQPPAPAVERIEDKSAAPKTTDELLTQLKRERDPDTAKVIAATIATQWADSGSPTVNLLMQWADKAIKTKSNTAAMDFLDQAITLQPDYAYGWARRAALHYTMGNDRKAVSDLNHVLKIEPRHFGAIEMLANILGEMGSEEKSLKAWQDYLEVYPADRAAQKAASDLAEKLAGART
ncbi:hypothetical protein [Rhizobium sp.]|jgi:tetratricopeptide (TPR) repeat protein|uniref:hypothetical protein n=1 Tax=Rhizobium sp. TaxID=391 RepID=UPI000E9A84E5|nr:hypothetical protein [Rhizobium sp.]